jgi:hypothetical protein
LKVGITAALEGFLEQIGDLSGANAVRAELGRRIATVLETAPAYPFAPLAREIGGLLDVIAESAEEQAAQEHADRVLAPLKALAAQ